MQPDYNIRRQYSEAVWSRDAPEAGWEAMPKVHFDNINSRETMNWLWGDDQYSPVFEGPSHGRGSANAFDRNYFVWGRVATGSKYGGDPAETAVKRSLIKQDMEIKKQKRLNALENAIERCIMDVSDQEAAQALENVLNKRRMDLSN